MQIRHASHEVWGWAAITSTSNATSTAAGTTSSTATGSTGATSAPSATDASSASSEMGTTSVKLSKKGELMAALEQLKQQNPDGFSSVVSNLATEVRQQASTATGHEQDVLQRLADKLDKVAWSGDVSALESHPRPHHHGERAWGPAAYPPSQASSGTGTSASSGTSGSTSATSGSTGTSVSSGTSSSTGTTSGSTATSGTGGSGSAGAVSSTGSTASTGATSSTSSSPVTGTSSTESSDPLAMLDELLKKMLALVEKALAKETASTDSGSSSDASTVPPPQPGGIKGFMESLFGKLVAEVKAATAGGAASTSGGTSSSSSSSSSSSGGTVA